MIAVVLPTLDTPEPLARVLGELPADLLAIVVDDASREPIPLPARPATMLVRHDTNRGYGAAQKSGFAEAFRAGADRIVLLHGDGQYPTLPTLALAEALGDEAGPAADAALGSRFLVDPAVIPTWRRWGNAALTGLANLRFGTSFSELHTGARAYRADALRRLPLDRFSDDFLFDQQVICALIRSGSRFVERPVGTHYGAGARSISPLRSVRYAAGCVREILR